MRTAHANTGAKVSFLIFVPKARIDYLPVVKLLSATKSNLPGEYL